MPFSLTIQNVLNLASQFTELIPLAGVGGIANEPALTIANETMSEICGEKFPWRCNRKEMPSFFTMRGQQDYKFAGACAFGLNDAQGVSIDLAANNAITESSFTVTVNTLDPHNFLPGQAFFMTGNTVAAYNSTFTQTPDTSTWSNGWTILATPTNKQFTFTHASSGLAASGAPGITDFGWLEAASMVDPASGNTPQTTRVLWAVRNLEPNGVCLEPNKLCVLQDLQTGVIRIRLNAAAANRWQINPVYQAKPPLKVSLSDTWTPFPDELAYVYRQMFIAQAYRFANSARSEVEYQKAMANIAKGLGSDDREDSSEYVVPDCPLMTNGYFGSGWVF